MRIRHAALAAAVAFQLVASVVLVIKANATPEHSIDESELAAARAAFQRRQAARSAPPPPRQAEPEPRRPAASRQRPEPEPEPEPEPRRRETAQVERSRPTLAQREPADSPSGPVEVDDVRTPFDRGQFIEALELAEEYLERDPDQAYIRRVAVTSACATGQLEVARRYYEQMDERDQRTSERRCARYGIDEL